MRLCCNIARVMPTQYSIRRANLEDLPVLRGLWETARLPATQLERHLTDFHVALRPDGVVVGTMALRVAGLHGLVYGESFSSSAQEREARPVLWERLSALAQTHGCCSLWLRGSGNEFWHSAGFRQPARDELTALPQDFGGRSGTWLTLVLRQEGVLPENLAERFARLQEEEHARTERLRVQARLLKWIAGLIAVAFSGAALWLLFKLLSSVSRR